MISIILKRLLVAIPGIFVLSAVLFFCVGGLLGDPAAEMLGLDATPQSIADLSAKLGLNRPLLSRYFDWLRHALVGDFGRSYSTPQTVLQAILPRLPVTFELSVEAILVAVIASVLLYSSTTMRAVTRPLVKGLSIVGIAMPNFVVGLILIIVFSVRLGWLPSVGWAPWSAGLREHFSHILLPVLALSAHYFASFTLIYGAQYDSVSRSVFVRVAVAKGLSQGRVSFAHILPNSILPVIAYAALGLGQLVGGAVVVETLFSIPGVGSLLVDAVLSHDLPVMLAVGEIVMVAVIVLSLFADLLCCWLNPQVRLR